jgi:hypothetical protein
MSQKGRRKEKTKGSVPGPCVANFIEYQTRTPSNGGVYYDWTTT